MVKNINENLGDPVVFDTVEDMAAELENLGYLPDDGLIEGRDYEVVEES